MLKKAVRRVWRSISPTSRARLVRATQEAFTVSTAAIVTNEKYEVLLLNHVLRPYAGWGFPGGFLEKGEQAEDAVRREVREETGIELEQLELYCIHTSATHIEILFSARGVGEPEVRSREIIELGWFSVDQIPDEIPRVQKQHVREVLARRFDKQSA